MEKKSDELNLRDFYKLMKKIRETRQEILSLILENKKVPKTRINALRVHYSFLKDLKKQNSEFVFYYKNKKIKSRLYYELNELKRDLIYLEKGEKALLRNLSSSNKGFYEQKKKIVEKLNKTKFDVFITDRDGTINNSSERYLSSIQPIYNGLFFARFILKKTKNSIILTSGPLNDFQRVNIFPKIFAKKHNLIFSGSKGSEFILNKKVKIPLNKTEKLKLKILENRIKKLLSNENYEIFYLIGSGFQVKHGQLSIAKQDMFKSINKNLSDKFSKEIKNVVRRMDSKAEYFIINDTGNDIEITLNIKGKKFDKYRGIEFVLRELALKPENTLVCGDSDSDLRFFEYIQKISKECCMIFVTKNPKMKKRVKKRFPKTVFVSSPDILIAGLNDLSKIK